MSLNLVKLYYRSICKENNEHNRKVFRNVIKDEINKFQNNMTSQNLEYWNKFITNYLKMQYHVNKENALLDSYNINIPRDSKKEIESIARKVGLQI